MAPPSDSNKKRNPFKSIISGGISGGVEILVTFPTEYVKTQLQLDERAAKPKYRGPWHCVTTTVKHHGYLGLYRGLSSLFYGSIPKAAVRFSGYEFFRNRLLDSDGNLGPGRSLLAGLGAGMLEAIVIVCPMETVKVKFIHDQTQPKPQYRGFLHGTKCMIAADGVRGIYQGLGPTIMKQGSNQAIRFLVYNQMKVMWQGGDRDKKLNPFQTIISGALAGAASVFGNTPVDVVKTRMQGLDAAKYKGAWDCVKQIWKNEGAKGFYKGTVPRLGRVCADVALVFTLYEFINAQLDKVWKD